MNEVKNPKKPLIFYYILVLVAMLLFCGVRQRVERSNPPESFKGLPITLVSAAITSMSFMGFGGLVENIIAALM